MVEQLYRDVRVLRIYEGTSQIQQVIIAKNLVARRLNGELLS
jgi:acyl-CoA dehydrogenase